jgi:hypothetical protein
MPHCLPIKVGLLGAHKSTLRNAIAHAPPPALPQATHRANALADPCWHNKGLASGVGSISNIVCAISKEKKEKISSRTV